MRIFEAEEAKSSHSADGSSGCDGDREGRPGQPPIFDDDPENLIKFYGVSPQPVKAKGYGRDRAQTTIAFFELSDPTSRKNLFRERAAMIVGLWPQLEAASKDTGNAIASNLVADYQSEKAPHANCARSFAKLHKKDRAEAERLFQAAAEFIRSIS